MLAEKSPPMGSTSGVNFVGNSKSCSMTADERSEQAQHSSQHAENNRLSQKLQLQWVFYFAADVQRDVGCIIQIDTFVIDPSKLLKRRKAVLQHKNRLIGCFCQAARSVAGGERAGTALASDGLTLTPEELCRTRKR
jgi:hypothetical protein